MLVCIGDFLIVLHLAIAFEWILPSMWYIDLKSNGFLMC